MKTMLFAFLWLWVQTPAPQSPAVSHEYTIGPKDVIAIVIFNDESLSRPALTVDVEGTVDCPFIGRVKVGGLTPRQVEDLLVMRYAEGWLVNPSISVVVKEYRNLVVYVQGAVKIPGAVDLEGDPTLLSALGEAGSFASDAGSYVVITPALAGREGDGPAPRDAAGTPGQIRVTRDDIATGRASAIRLSAGDTVFVPKAAMFFITGQVRAPNSYVLTDGLTVLQALALAGGATDRAAMNRISVQRIVDGEKVETRVKETDLVLAGDTIVVPTRYF